MVGGGFLGMEIASVAAGLGLDVTVVDLQAPFVATLGPYLAALFERATREHGVRAVVPPGGVTPMPYGAQLADGRRLEADLVAAVGCRPTIEWLEGAGLSLLGGIVVDERCRAGAPDVVAGGDVAAFPTGDGHFRRAPRWDSAIGQARADSAALLHGDGAPPYTPQPYFWTEAFGLAVKLAGTLPAAGEPTVLKGSVSDLSALLCWDHASRPVAAALNHRIAVVRLRAIAVKRLLPPTPSRPISAHDQRRLS